MLVEDVPGALRTQLGPDATAGLLALFETTRHEWAAEVTSVALHRFEQRLTNELAGVRADLVDEIHASESATRRQLNECVAALRRDMHAIRDDLMKWTLLACVSQVVAMTLLAAVVLFWPG